MSLTTRTPLPSCPPTKDYRELAKRTKRLQAEGRFWEAQAVSRKIISLLTIAARPLDDDVDQKIKIYEKVMSYLLRIQFLIDKFEYNQYKKDSELLEVSQIYPNTYNYNFVELFQKYCNKRVKEVIIYEDMFNCPKHVQCLRQFLALLLAKCPNLRFIKVKSMMVHRRMFEVIRLELSGMKVFFDYDLFHQRRWLDSKIIFSTGIVILMERGIPYMKFEQQNLKRQQKIEENRIEVFYTDILKDFPIVGVY